jgi:hypothetical protein
MPRPILPSGRRPAALAAAPQPARTPAAAAARAPTAAAGAAARAAARDPADRQAADDAAGGAPPPGARLDGRRAHVLDRAAEYVRLADHGLTVSAIARRRRKSKGHVSILLRLGRALADLPADERAALRHPRVTWRLVQGLVRADVDAASLRRQLRAALGGFSTHNVDRRRQARRARDAAPTGAAAAPGVAWGWDAAWFGQDPTGYAAAHLAHLVHLHEAVTARAEQAVRARALADLDAGQSLRGLQRRLAQLANAAGAEPGPGAERDALHALATVGRALDAARREVAGLAAATGAPPEPAASSRPRWRAAVPATPAVPAPRRDAPAPVDDVTADDLDADLADA